MLNSRSKPVQVLTASALLNSGRVGGEKAASALGHSSLEVPQASSSHPSPASTAIAHVAIFTGGGDKPYALGIAEALSKVGVCFDFIGSDDLSVPEILHNPFARFLNLRGDQNPRAPGFKKLSRVLIYYFRLFVYAFSTRTKVFHILWHNKFQWFDRTLLLLFYRMLGKRIVYTAHNVNTQARDGRDSAWNRLTLRLQYRWVDHVFVHTQKMKVAILDAFHVPDAKVTVIPFGINSTNPQTNLTGRQARQFFGLEPEDKTILFFGNIAPYKGLEVLVDAFARIVAQDPGFRLIIGGRLKCSDEYWQDIQDRTSRLSDPARVIQRIEFIPDAQVEIFFKAADILVLPYTAIFQSGVLFLGYNFGLPVVVADVGSLKEEIVEGETGFAFAPGDSAGLARVLQKYFESSLYQNLEERRPQIRAYAQDRYSWTKVAGITADKYSELLQPLNSRINR